MMKRTYNIIIATLAAAAMSLLVAGCQKQDGQDEGAAFPLSFEVTVGDSEIDVLPGDATKADNRKTSSSTIDNFTVAGYTGSTEWFPQTTVSTSSMTFSDKLWMPGDKHTFFAYANMPGSIVATASIASDKLTLNYSAVPTLQADQKDILLGVYSGTGTNGKASIKFYHPLAAVAFKVGTISGVTEIKSISLLGVYSSGETYLKTSGLLGWKVSPTKNVLQEISVTTFTTNTALGDPFILIPQDFSEQSLTVQIVATVNSAEKTVTATLNTGSIAAGKTTTYAVNYEASSGLNFSTPTVTEWGTATAITVPVEELPKITLPGRFSVSSSKQVYFAKGNLWYGKKDGAANPTFNIEENQWGYQPAVRGNGEWNPDHISHFYWSRYEDEAYAEIYPDSPKTSTSFFTNDPSDDTKANKNFTVEGLTGQFRLLSVTEWDYLFNTRVVNGGQGFDYSFTSLSNSGVEIFDGVQGSGYFIYPDDYEGQPIDFDLGTGPSTWAELEALGIVFLPAPGMREGNKVDGIQNGHCECWTSTYSGYYGFECAYYFGPFSDGHLYPDGYFNEGNSVRLVKDVE